MLTIIGPTACGKTKFAVRLAKELDGEIISADSRQVYRHMDLGTGKDLIDYNYNGQQIPYHLIDIAEPGTKYNVYQYQRDFINAYRDVTQRGKLPILCGGTGLYVESVIKGYRMSFVPESKELRTSLQHKTLDELTGILKSYKTLHNKTDVDTAQRAIRAIEIEEYYRTHPEAGVAEEGEPDRKAIFNEIQGHNTVVGLMIEREVRRARITERLRQRLEEGMLDEIRQLINRGISPQDLIYYGLEYKYLTLHVIGKLTFDEMFRLLEIAIHQFAKRQMTWFRGMEKRGTHIHWLNALDDYDKNIQIVKELIQR